MKKILLLILASISVISIKAITPEELTIYVNPGHGGYDSDDRNVVISPFTQGDPNGYWESKSNLVKGLALRDLLLERGYKVGISRVTNTTADDLGLTVIGELANSANADLFLSIHSNATGTGTRRNAPLMLFRGYDNDAVYPESPKVGTIINKYLLKNEATVWTSTAINVRGDWDFYSWGTSGLGVLRALKMTGVLSEGSFHDYVPEAYRLMNNDYCWTEAWHFLKSIEEYYNISGETVGYLAGVVYDGRVLRNEEFIMFDRDNNIPINAVKVDLCNLDGDIIESYTTDDINNGFFLFKKVTPGKYILKISKDTHEPSQAEVEVTANEITYSNLPMKKIRNTAPEVIEYTPVWKEGDEPLLANTPITMEFNWDMDIASTEAAFSITPAVEGTFEWSDANYLLTFTPKEAYDVNTLYTVKLAKTAQHAGGMEMGKDFSFTFATDSRNYMKVLANYPYDGAVLHTISPVVYISTDKPLYAPSAYQNIQVKDPDGNVLSYISRSLSYSKTTDNYGWIKIPLSKALEEGKQYSVVYPRDIADHSGIKIKDEIVANFTAENLANQVDANVATAFENVEDYTVNEDKSSAFTCTLSKNTTKLFGSACLGAKYTFTESNAGKIYITLPTSTETFTSNDALKMYIYGDITLNSVSVEMVSSDDTRIVPLGAVNYLGWQAKTVKLYNQLADGKEYSVKGIIINQENAIQGVSGDIRFDNLANLKNQGGVESTTFANVSVYPNPASEYVIVNGDTQILGLSLFSLDGKNIANASGNVMNVSETAEGTYLLKIQTAGATITEKVVVSHNN